MKINKIFLLITLVLLFVGLSYASEISNDTTISETSTNIEKDTCTDTNVADSHVKEEIRTDKQIQKQINTNKTTKMASKTYNVTNYDTLHKVLTKDTYDTVTINIKSNIILTDDTTLNEAIKQLTINGNGKTIDGKNQFRFLSISSSNTVTINNIKITNCYTDGSGGAIYNNGGTLIMNNSILKNNTAKYYGGAINSNGHLTLLNIKLYNNNAIFGGAIHNDYWGTTNIYNTTLYSNTVARNGGAILNVGKLTLKDSELKNNLAIYGGGIHNEYGGILEIYNSTLKNNIAQYLGGAICNYLNGFTYIYNSILNNNSAVDSQYYDNNGGAIFSRSNLTVINSTISNNKAFHGGAIYNTCNLTINNTVLNNNFANYSGGAIHNNDNTIIYNTTFINNQASFYGGAIINGGTVTVTDSTLENNMANNKGGAIDNSGYLKIKNSNLNSNYAEYGGAIYNYAYNVNILNNTFMNNSAYMGSAVFAEGEVYLNVDDIYIYDGTNLTVKNNNFVKNKANITGKAIIDEGINTTIKNNINDDISQDSSTVHLINTFNSTVTYNLFDDGRKMTVLTVNKIGNTKYGETITIEGMLKNSDNKALSSANIVITLNEKNIKVKTDSKGYYTYKTTASTVGTNNVTVTFKGNTKYYSSSNKTSFTVKQPTMIKHTYMGNVNIGTTVKILARLISNVTGQAIKYATVTVKINDDTYKIKSDGAGYIRMNYTVNSYDEQKITFSYAGSSLNMASSNSTSFKVKQPTWIKLGYTGNVVYGSTVKLVARLLTKDNTAVKYVTVNVTVNGKFYQVKSDGAGYIRLNYTVNTYDDQKVIYKFGGSSLYMASSNSTSFKVKQSTWIKHAVIGKVKLGSIVKIVGRVLYNGTNSVKYVPVNVTVNGNVYQLKTDGAGYYRLNYTATTAGVNTFTSNFGGNTLYLASTNSTKFTVVK